MLLLSCCLRWLKVPALGRDDSSGSDLANWKPICSCSAAVCAGFRCQLLVVIVSQTGPDAKFFFVLRKRVRNLGGRVRAADQTLAFETSVLRSVPRAAFLIVSLQTNESSHASVASRCSNCCSPEWTPRLGSLKMHSTRQVPLKSTSQPLSEQTALA